MFYVEVRERMCQTFVPPVIRYKVGLSHFIDIVHLVYNKEGIAPDFESSDCQLHSHNQRWILRNVALLEHGSGRANECGIRCPSGVIKIMPTPEDCSFRPFIREAPSKYISHGARANICQPRAKRSRDRQGCRNI